MTKRYRKKITVVISLVLPVILLFAILNCFTTYVFYEDYKYKMNLMTEIAAKEEFSGLDAVSELLKDKDIETNEQGRRLLEQYGYWGNKGNAFYSQFRHQVMVTGAISTVICVLLLTFLLYWKKKEDVPVQIFSVFQPVFHGLVRDIRKQVCYPPLKIFPGHSVRAPQCPRCSLGPAGRKLSTRIG